MRYTLVAVALTFIAAIGFAAAAYAQSVQGEDALSPRARTTLISTLNLTEPQIEALDHLEARANARRAALVDDFEEQQDKLMQAPPDADRDRHLAMQVESMRALQRHDEALQADTQRLLDDVETLLDEQQRPLMDTARARIEHRTTLDFYTRTIPALRAEPAVVASRLNLPDRLDAADAGAFNRAMQAYDRAIAHHVAVDRRAQERFIDALDPARGIPPEAYTEYLDAVAENLVALADDHAQHADAIRRVLPEPLRNPWRRLWRVEAYPWLAEPTYPEIAIEQVRASERLTPEEAQAVAALKERLARELEQLRREAENNSRTAISQLDARTLTGSRAFDARARLVYTGDVNQRSIRTRDELLKMLDEARHDLIPPLSPEADDEAAAEDEQSAQTPPSPDR
jgi:hypothetical protein